MMNRAAKLIVVLVMLASPVFAQDWEKGGEAFKNGDYETAFEEWKPLAEQGVDKAQIGLGLLYAEGRGVGQDAAESIKWYGKAAGQGNAYAQYVLGTIYFSGDMVPQDFAQAENWHRKAAKQGHPWAQNNLGVLYANGLGVEQSYIVAHVWYSLATHNGGRRSILNTEVVSAELSPADLAEARALAQKCLESGYEDCP